MKRLTVALLAVVALCAPLTASAHDHNAALDVPGNVVTSTGHIHGHIMPRPGESLLTLPVDAMAEAGDNAIDPDDNCPDCGGEHYVREGGWCWPIGSAAPCISGGCRIGTCVCSAFHWVFIG